MINPGELAFIILIATAGKLVGAMLSRPFTHLRWKQLYVVGWAMNSRGAVEFALALIALRAGLIGTHLYSAIIAMALVTTVTFPFIITPMLRRDPHLLD